MCDAGNSGNDYPHGPTGVTGAAGGAVSISEAKWKCAKCGHEAGIHSERAMNCWDRQRNEWLSFCGLCLANAIMTAPIYLPVEE